VEILAFPTDAGDAGDGCDFDGAGVRGGVWAVCCSDWGMVKT